MAAQHQEVRAQWPTSDEIDQLIREYIEFDPDYPGLENARIKGRRLRVTVLVIATLGAGGEISLVADDYELPRDAVRAAIFYYGMNKSIFDAKMILEAAAFEPDDPLLTGKV